MRSFGYGSYDCVPKSRRTCKEEEEEEPLPTSKKDAKETNTQVGWGSGANGWGTVGASIITNELQSHIPTIAYYGTRCLEITYVYIYICIYVGHYSGFCISRSPRRLCCRSLLDSPSCFYASLHWHPTCYVQPKLLRYVCLRGLKRCR